MTEKRITLAEKFAATIAILEGAEPEIEFDAVDAVEFLKDRAEKAKSKPRERKVKPEVAEFRARVAEFMAGQAEPMTAKEVGVALGVSSQKAGAHLRALVAEGEIVAHDGEKARDAKTYEIAR
jgi:predicted HTH transcriptional regulator